MADAGSVVSATVGKFSYQSGASGSVAGSMLCSLSLYPGSATAATCLVSDLIGSGISYYNSTNVYWVTSEQGKSAAYLNGIGFQVTEV